jgi:hypothetical protein
LVAPTEIGRGTIPEAEKKSKKQSERTESRYPENMHQKNFCCCCCCNQRAAANDADAID